jgi:hypothetical protein
MSAERDGETVVVDCVRFGSAGQFPIIIAQTFADLRLAHLGFGRSDSPLGLSRFLIGGSRPVRAIPPMERNDVSGALSP